MFGQDTQSNSQRCARRVPATNWRFARRLQDRENSPSDRDADSAMPVRGRRREHRRRLRREIARWASLDSQCSRREINAQTSRRYSRSSVSGSYSGWPWKKTSRPFRRLMNRSAPAADRDNNLIAARDQLLLGADHCSVNAECARRTEHQQGCDANRPSRSHKRRTVWRAAAAARYRRDGVPPHARQDRTISSKAYVPAGPIDQAGERSQ